MLFHPFLVRHYDCAVEASSAPAPCGRRNSPESDRGTVYSKPRLDRRENLASTDGSNGDRDRGEDRSAMFGLPQSEPVPGWRSVDRVRLDSEFAAIRGGRFLRSGGATIRGTDGIPGSKAGAGDVHGVCWRDVRFGWAQPDAAQKLARTLQRPEISTGKIGRASCRERV